VAWFFSTSAISWNPDPRYGLTLPVDTGSTTLSCTDYSNFLKRSPVTFGEDVISGCTLHLTSSDLTGTNCDTLRALIWRIQTGYIAGVGTAMTHVAKWGNSSYQNIWDWVPILNNIPDGITGETVINPLNVLPNSLSSQVN